MSPSNVSGDSDVTRLPERLSTVRSNPSKHPGVNIVISLLCSNSEVACGGVVVDGGGGGVVVVAEEEEGSEIRPPGEKGQGRCQCDMSLDNTTAGGSCARGTNDGTRARSKKASDVNAH